jgi:hypothetical protein
MVRQHRSADLQPVRVALANLGMLFLNAAVWLYAIGHLLGLLLP